MENQKISQLELFSETGNGTAETKKRNSFSLFTYLRNYEKVIFIIIGFLITSLVSFSLGVKKGKEMTASRVNTRLDIATLSKEIPSLVKTVDKQIKREPSIEKEATLKEVNLESMQKYTIQVASFQTNSLAQKEAERLRKKGFSVLILSKGKYTVVCVGNFNNQESAKSSLSELKKSYSDCFVRRL